MKKSGLKIGLALSGGGMRAVIFHLGVLKYLAERKLLENVEYISTVSGGSICVALMYTNNNMRWVSSEEYLMRVLPTIRRILLKDDIEMKLIVKSISDIFHIFDTKSKKLAKTMKIFWGIDGKLSELPLKPRWDINAVTYESGKRFFFSKEKCGDMTLGYFYGENIELSEAVSASAGFPILIGMYELKREKYIWYDKECERKREQPKGKLHLWDGGVYDNLGVEPIFNSILNEEEKLNFYIVSDAGASNDKFVPYRKSIFGRTKAIKRLLDISMEQVDSLNSKFYKQYIQERKNGLYVRIGTDIKNIKLYNRHNKIINVENSMVCKWAESYPTNLRKPSEEEFDKLLQHGYETVFYMEEKQKYLI